MNICPKCGRESLYMNINRDHYFYCEEDRVAWYIGSNIFSDWRDEDPSVWEFNRKRLSRFEVIEEIAQ